MKKAVVLSALILFLGVSAGSFAAESEYYTRTIYIEKVYPHQFGYKIMYTTSKLDIATAYIPHKWFAHSSTTSDGQMVKGELVTGIDNAYPYMMVFWKGGKFSHVRLFLKKDFNDLSFGVLNPAENIDAKFNIEEPALEF